MCFKRNAKLPGVLIRLRFEKMALNAVGRTEWKGQQWAWKTSRDDYNSSSKK